MTTRTLERLLMTADLIPGVIAADEEVSFVGVGNSRRQLGNSRRHLDVVTVDSTQSVAAMARLSDLHSHSYHDYCATQQIGGKEGRAVCRKPHG